MQRTDAHPELFEAYRQLLNELVSRAEPEPLLRVFEKHVLEALGFGMALECECDTGNPVTAEGWYIYFPERGLVRHADGPAVGEGSGNRLISGEALLALQSNRIEARHTAELKLLMRRVLRHHLGDKPMASQALFK